MAETITAIAAAVAAAAGTYSAVKKPKVPKQDTSALEAQGQELAEQKKRQAELEAEKGASARAQNSRSAGRQLLSYTPGAGGGAKTLGG